MLAQHISKRPNLRLRGLQGYEGHCMHETVRETRIQKVRAAMDHLGETIDLLEKNGFECEVVSSGGTGTYDLSGSDERVTEIQAGSYVFMDNFHARIVTDFLHALTVLGTVVNQHGKTIVIDAGKKSVSVDLASPTMLPYPFYKARSFAEEHALFEVDERCQFKLGDTVDLIPGYAPSTVNIYDVYHVVEKDMVVDIWPILPRGPGHLGIFSEL